MLFWKKINVHIWSKLVTLQSELNYIYIFNSDNSELNYFVPYFYMHII